MTSNLANTVGQKEATAVVNQAKTQVIADNITNIEQIQNVVNEVADDQQVTIDDEQMSQILDLLDKIAQEDYNYEDMADTLQRVEENVSDLNDKVDSLTASTMRNPSRQPRMLHSRRNQKPWQVTVF